MDDVVNCISLSVNIFFVFLEMQVSFLLGVIPVFIAWMYSEFLEYKRSSLHSKVYVLFYFIYISFSHVMYLT